MTNIRVHFRSWSRKERGGSNWFPGRLLRGVRYAAPRSFVIAGGTQRHLARAVAAAVSLGERDQSAHRCEHANYQRLLVRIPPSLVSGLLDLVRSLAKLGTKPAHGIDLECHRAVQVELG